MIHGLVSVIIPTAGRLSWIKAVNSLFETTADFPVECIMAVDGDERLVSDVEHWGDIPFAEGGYKYRDGDYWQYVVEHNSIGGALRGWNMGLKAARGEFIVMGADDLYFHESWLYEAYRANMEYFGGNGCVGFNDLQHKDALQTHFLMHRSFILEHLGGALVTPLYSHYCVDHEIVERAKYAGLYVYAPKAIVEHMHYSNKKRAVDEWDEKAMAHVKEDRELLASRRTSGFPNDYEPVITE